MNRKQKIVLWIGIVIIVLMCLFPPWIITIKVENKRIALEKLSYSARKDFPEKITIKQYYGFILKTPELYFYSDFDIPFYCDVSPEKYLPSRGGYYIPSLNWRGITQNAFIDIRLLIIECVIVALVTVGLLFTFTTKAKCKPQEQKNRTFSEIGKIEQRSCVVIPSESQPILQEKKNCWLATISFILGILGLLLFCVAIFPALLGLPAVICGHLALSKIKRSHGTLKGRSIAIAGLSMGYIALAFTALVILIASVEGFK